MSTVLFWILVSLFAIGAAFSVLTIGRKREPTTPGVALVTVLINAALIVSLFVSGAVR